MNADVPLPKLYHHRGTEDTGTDAAVGHGTP